jgi:hypothetical protein
LSDAAKKKLLEELLRRRKARQKKRLKERGREDFPEHLERRQIDLDLDEKDKQGLDLLDVKVFERLRFERPRMYVEIVNRYIYVRRGDPEVPNPRASSTHRSANGQTGNATSPRGGWLLMRWADWRQDDSPQCE